MYLFCAAGMTWSVTDLAEKYKMDDPEEESCEEGGKPNEPCGDKVYFSRPSV